MAVPKKRSTSSRRNRRRSHHALSGVVLMSCAQCGQKVQSHTVCDNCGYYRGKRQVIDVLAKLTKRERKAKEKELEERHGEEASPVPASLDAEQLSQRS